MMSEFKVGDKVISRKTFIFSDGTGHVKGDVLRIAGRGHSCPFFAENVSRSELNKGLTRAFPVELTDIKAMKPEKKVIGKAYFLGIPLFTIKEVDGE